MQLIHYPGLPTSTDGCLAKTEFHDFGDPLVAAFVADTIRGATGTRDKVVRLFYAVRDSIRYDPYRIGHANADYTASSVLRKGFGWCIPKAVLLGACARAIGIPSAIGLADVVNHLTTEKLREKMGGVSTFYDHGYTALFLDGHWVKAVPAFNIELCERFGVKPTEFDGRGDALYQEYDVANRRHMEYLRDHGTWNDLPAGPDRADFAKHYPGTLMTQSSSVGEDERFERDKRVD